MKIQCMPRVWNVDVWDFTRVYHEAREGEILDFRTGRTSRCLIIHVSQGSISRFPITAIYYLNAETIQESSYGFEEGNVSVDGIIEANYHNRTNFEQFMAAEEKLRKAGIQRPSY